MLNDARRHIGSHDPLQLSGLELLSEAELDDMLRVLDLHLHLPGTARSAGGPRPERGRPAGKSKAGSIVSAALFYGLLFCLIGCAFLLAQGDKKPIFGYSFMNVITGSMKSVIPPGSMVVVKKVAPDTIRVGDDITYAKDDETSVTHRIIGIIENFEGTGERGFETQGVDNDTPDFEIVRAANVVGAVRFHIPKVGQWLEWLRGNLFIVLGFTAGFVLLAILLKGVFKKAPEEKRRAQARRLLSAY